MTRRIRLTSGRYTFVSDHRYKELRKYHWNEHGDGYISRRVLKANGKYDTILMHRQILGLGLYDKRFADHINRNRKDNRDENLRLATRFDNAHNRTKYACNKTGYKGVHWREQYQIYSCTIKVNRKVIHLGHFDNPEIAAHVYDNAARRYHGEFAVTNFKDVIPDATLLRGKRTRATVGRNKGKRLRRVHRG